MGMLSEHAASHPASDQNASDLSSAAAVPISSRVPSILRPETGGVLPGPHGDAAAHGTKHPAAGSHECCGAPARTGPRPKGHVPRCLTSPCFQLPPLQLGTDLRGTVGVPSGEVLPRLPQVREGFLVTEDVARLLHGLIFGTR